MPHATGAERRDWLGKRRGDPINEGCRPTDHGGPSRRRGALGWTARCHEYLTRDERQQRSVSDLTFDKLISAARGSDDGEAGDPTNEHHSRGIRHAPTRNLYLPMWTGQVADAVVPNVVRPAMRAAAKVAVRAARRFVVPPSTPPCSLRWRLHQRLSGRGFVSFGTRGVEGGQRKAFALDPRGAGPPFDVHFPSPRIIELRHEAKLG